MRSVAIEWSELFHLTVSPIELMLRGSVVYVGLVALFAVARNREAGPMSQGNMLVLILMAASTHHALVGESTSISDSFVVVVTILAWSYAIDWLRFRLPFVNDLLRSKPLLLVDHGRLVARNLERESITQDELHQQLRLRGIENISQVRRAYMEADGQLSVIPFEGPVEPPRPGASAA
jgi:uncharacterized membrane protein YcaP (DUF421 family)